MIRLFVRMRRRRSLTGISDRMKRAYDTYILDVLKLLFIHLEALQENPGPFRLQDLSCYLYDEEVDLERYPLNPKNLFSYCSQLR